MGIEDFAMYDGEVRVIPRRQYEVVRCEGGQPLAVAAFNSEDDAKEYALALNRRRAHSQLIDKCKEVILEAATHQQCHRNGDGGEDIFDIDFDGALDLFKMYDDLKWGETDAD